MAREMDNYDSRAAAGLVKPRRARELEKAVSEARRWVDFEDGETDDEDDEPLWLEYLACVVPSDAGENRIRETRRAFYAGAKVLMTEIIRQLLQEQDIYFPARVMAELEEFMRRVTAGEA
jgi:hypothetical protein